MHCLARTPMTIHQPGYAHFAAVAAIVALAIVAASRFARPYFARKHGPLSEADDAKARVRRRRSRFAAAVALAQLVLEPLSIAFDFPHHTSIRTQIIHLTGPCLVLIIAYLPSEPAKKARSEDENCPYYAAAPGERPSKTRVVARAKPAARWRGLSPPKEEDPERAEL